MSFLQTVRDHYGEPERPPPTNVTSAAALTGDTPYGIAALTSECQLVAQAGEGTRDDTLNRAAYRMGRLIASGQLTETTARNNLAAAARQTGQPEQDIQRALRDNTNGGLHAGRTNPRTIPDRAATAEPSRKQDTSATDDQADETAPEHTSWWPRDLARVIDGTQNEPGPSHLTRTDGQALFYAGKVNGLIGESESGKTWVALLAVQQALHGGEHVLYLDFEDSATGIIGRLRALGTTAPELARFTYIDPDETLHIAAKMDLNVVLDTHQPALIVLDGFNAAMTLLGLDLQSNKDATTFSQALLKPLSRTTATVIYIDHLPKNREAQGKGGIGAQAKRAMTTGCALRVDIAVEFGRGMTGRLKLTVDKDRAGHVRAASAGAKVAGEAVLISASDGSRVDLEILAPDLRPLDERGPFRPTGLMEKASRFLESGPGPWSFRNVKEAVSGKDQYLRDALYALVEDGYAAREPGPRGATLHRSIRAYREDPLTVSRPCPTVSRDTVNDRVPVSPTLGGDTDTVSWSTTENNDRVPDDTDDEPWWQK